MRPRQLGIVPQGQGHQPRPARPPAHTAAAVAAVALRGPEGRLPVGRGNPNPNPNPYPNPNPNPNLNPYPNPNPKPNPNPTQVAIQIQGIDGDFCSPKCSFFRSRPTD